MYLIDINVNKIIELNYSEDEFGDTTIDQPPPISVDTSRFSAYNPFLEVS